MQNSNVFNAINESQDGKSLHSWVSRNQAQLDDLHWDFFDALSATIVLAYREASDSDDLESELSYCLSQLEEALGAVKREVRSV